MKNESKLENWVQIVGWNLEKKIKLFQREKEREKDCQMIALPSFPYLYSFYVPENCQLDNLLGNTKWKEI